MRMERKCPLSPQPGVGGIFAVGVNEDVFGCWLGEVVEDMAAQGEFVPCPFPRFGLRDYMRGRVKITQVGPTWYWVLL